MKLAEERIFMKLHKLEAEMECEWILAVIGAAVILVVIAMGWTR